jgi:hypothetical protein
MSDGPGNKPPFNIHLPGASALAAIGGLAAALQVAIETAISPARIEINGETQRARLETLTKQLLHEAKSIPTEGLSSADEARGVERPNIRTTPFGWAARVAVPNETESNRSAVPTPHQVAELALTDRCGRPVVDFSDEVADLDPCSGSRGVRQYRHDAEVGAVGFGGLETGLSADFSTSLVTPP